MMYFSKATLSRDAFGRDRNWTLATNGYQAHQIIWSLFSDQPERDRDFIFRWDTDSKLPTLFVVSEREPVDRENNFRSLRTKTYEPKLSAGQPLAFSLRANSVIKKRDDDGRQHVHDVVMNAKHEMRKAGTWEDCPLSQDELVQQEGFRWLDKRDEQYGYAVEENQVLTESHKRHEFKKAKNGRRIVISTIDFKGRLRVTDAEKFRDALINGIGPSKAFGCGLMLIRPL